MRTPLLSLTLVALACVARSPRPDQSAARGLPPLVASPAEASAIIPVRAGPFRLDMFERQRLLKQLTDLSFFTQLGPEMIVRKVRYPSEDGLGIPAYLFAPDDSTVQRPALLIVHGGVHGDFGEGYIPHIRSLVQEGYIIVAPEYRGSTGYGRAFYDAIDYGGKEVEDVMAAREFLRRNVANADLERLGIIGWSHGGFIAIHAVIRRPELFRMAVAHVPVADLPTRMRLHSAAYQRIFADQPAFGGTVDERPGPYVERSPIAHARRLQTPLLVHTASNDDDVFIIENHNLRDSMVAAGKDTAGLYHYREWQDPPGGHSFSRVDSRESAESWSETLEFIRRYLARTLQPLAALDCRPAGLFGPALDCGPD